MVTLPCPWSWSSWASSTCQQLSPFSLNHHHHHHHGGVGDDDDDGGSGVGDVGDDDDDDEPGVQTCKWHCNGWDAPCLQRNRVCPQSEIVSVIIQLWSSSPFTSSSFTSSCINLCAVFSGCLVNSEEEFKMRLQSSKQSGISTKYSLLGFKE